MGNQIFQRAYQAVEEANEAMKAAHTPQAQAEATEKVRRAKQALSQAFADSSNAERAQLMELQDTFYETSEEFMTEDF
ncbi:DUF3813 domain-containing protein [Bacillus shivajii]|uniref:DUF3813 domain-containing protein n=1 Tax=Bacillus shivajii TaxID=1983719 RepID=UPI001CF958D6|nr:DUF3813 domain-containing protein [Bacillus shivajii]UCZ52000.1 DUF3813 domain-containing protein [Bacillus shivajii]